MTDHGWQEGGCSRHTRHTVRRRQMICLPVTSSYEGCPPSYWRLTVIQDDRGRQDGSRRPDSLVLGRSIILVFSVLNNFKKFRLRGCWIQVGYIHFSIFCQRPQPRLSEMFEPRVKLSPCEIYACGGGHHHLCYSCFLPGKNSPPSVKKLPLEIYKIFGCSHHVG